MLKCDLKLEVENIVLGVSKLSKNIILLNCDDLNVLLSIFAHPAIFYAIRLSMD